MIKLKELRKKKGLTQEELATQFNEKYGRQYTTPAISMFENGKRIPETQSLMDFADFFGVSVDYLLGRDSRDRSEFGGPEKATKREMKQLEKIIDDPALTYNGAVIDEEDREKIRQALEIVFWKAKEKNKRKK